MEAPKNIQDASQEKLIKGGFSITFIIQRGKLRIDGTAPILARVTVNGKMTHMATKQYIRPERWLTEEHKTMGLTKDEKEMNDCLKAFEVAIKKRYLDTMLRDESLSAHKLKSSLLKAPEDGRPTEILELCDMFVKNYEPVVITQGYGKEALFRYKVLRDRIAQFIKDEYHTADLPLDCLTRQFLDKLYVWFRTVNKLNNNTTVKTLHRFSSIYKMARNNGWVNGDPFKMQSLHLDKVDRGYLSQDQLEVLYNKEFASERLEKIRDFFLFSCYTGLSFMDLKNLTYEQLKKWADGNLWISTKRTKTKVPVNVRLLDVPLQLIEKYKGKAPGNKVFPIPSNQKMNDYLKEISTVCGFPKDLTFHMARHTFATTVTLGNGVPIESVSKMLGHTNIKTTQIYARITDQKVNYDMEKLSEKLNGQHPEPTEPSAKSKIDAQTQLGLKRWAGAAGLASQRQ